MLEHKTLIEQQSVKKCKGTEHVEDHGTNKPDLFEGKPQEGVASVDVRSHTSTVYKQLHY